MAPWRTWSTDILRGGLEAFAIGCFAYHRLDGPPNGKRARTCPLEDNLHSGFKVATLPVAKPDGEK